MKEEVGVMNNSTAAGPKPTMTKLGSMTALPNSFNFGIPGNAQVQEHVEYWHGEGSWKTSTLRLLHRKPVQYTMLALLLLDILFIFTELFLMSTFPACYLVVRDCLACCPDDGRFLAGGGEEICEAGYATGDGLPECDEHKWHSVHLAEEVIFYGTVFILSLFMAENLLEMICMGAGPYFRHFFLALDFVVVLVSLALELWFHFHNEKLQEIVAMLVLMRVWRFVRIGHGLVEVTSELTHEWYEDAIRYANECERRLVEHDLPLPKATDNVLQKIHEHEHSEG